MNYLKIRTVIIALFLAATMLVVSAEGRSLNETDSQLPRLLFNDSQEKVTIQNGFGFTHEDGVYLIPEGSITYYSSDGIVRVFDSTGKQLLITNATDSQKISTPVGYFSATKIYRVPSGALINTKGINTLVTLNEKPIVTIIFENSTLTTNEKRTNSNILTLQDGVFNGYIEDAQYSGVNNLGSFITDWIIPSPAPNPSSYTVQYSIWNGIQPGMPDPGGKLSIVQPVIEWNFTHWTGSAVYKDSYHDFFYYAPMVP